MMKSMIAAAFVTAIAATAATAGGYTAPVKAVEPVVAVADAPAFSWSGAYAGVSAGKTGTKLDFSSVDDAGDSFEAKLDDDATSYGVFAGYRHQFNNNFVLGGELNYAKTGDFFEDLNNAGGLDTETYGAELQAGYAFDRVLPYVSVGKGKIFGEEATSFGLGVDYAATQNVIVGVKYTRSDLGEFAIDDVSKFEVDADTIALRVGYKF